MLRDNAVENDRDTKPGDRAQRDRQQHVGKPGVMSGHIAPALAVSDETLVDLAPSPARFRLQAGASGWSVSS